MSTDYFASYVNNILAPCQHDSIWEDGECLCDNTKGVFSGQYCEECQCKNFGICAVTTNSSSRWGCRCASHQKWVGTLCDKCYTKDTSGENCRGVCTSLDGVYSHHGPKCNTVCMPHASSAASRCVEVRSGGGECNACNGHGTCTESGQCECDDGYFTSRGGEQCSLKCSDAGINCPEGQGRCASIGGQLQCICEPGWYGVNCEDSCVQPGGNLLPCYGHGSCGYDSEEKLSCSCNTHWIGEYCEQRCPGDESYPSSCSGHGQCYPGTDTATCECRGSWEGEDCSCSAAYTCSGHGTCLPDASCSCFDYSEGTSEVHFAGAHCERCAEHWYGKQCHLYCDPAKEYVPDPDTIGLRIGCNGHGACSVEENNEYVTCVCDGTDPDTFCATCMPNYYPLLNQSNVSVPHCSVACEEGTCSQNGACNADYDGSNNICICDQYRLPGTGEILDTLDPVQNCATCRENWYPTLMTASNRCTKYCAADGKLEENKRIVFELSAIDRNYDLMGDTSAQKVCVATNNATGTFYEPDADCSVCSGEGTCLADGTCKCSEGTTGEYCNIQCVGPNGLKCSDHGRCKRSDLDLWFNPYTTDHRCECTPYDPYTSETRQRLIKRGFQVEPPPSPHYYGQYCEFHCPRYNSEICADRGDCKTGIAVDDNGFRKTCDNDSDCANIEGAFCARLSTPWDSLMKDSSGATGESFFRGGPSSPGHYTCANSEKCMDSIYSVDWDQFCVNMLNGWYPSVLNTAKCTYASEGQCLEFVEDFFMLPYDNDKTWCEAALEALVPPTRTEDVCGKNSHADATTWQNERVPVCWEYTLSTTCNAQPECIYDQRISYIEEIDTNCSNSEPPCPNFCKETNEQTCETKTYCRAKTCPDAIFEQSIESLCITEPPCDSAPPYGNTWANFCSDVSGELSKQTLLSPKDLFYSCHMFRNRKNPQLVEQSIPGGIDMNGVLRIFGEDVPLQNLRASFVDSVVPAGSACDTIDFTTNNFCKTHLERIAPSWYVPQSPKTEWFLPWLVACPEGPDSLWPSESQATLRRKELSLDCIAFHRIAGLDGDWTTAADEKDTIAYTEKKIWLLQCPGQADVETDTIQYSADIWPQNPSGCRLKSDPLMERWGGTGWTPAEVQEQFTQSCQDGLAAPWIPKVDPLPTLCDVGACHPEDECLLCSDVMSSCDKTASVQCTAPIAFNYRDENRCQHGGTAWQPLAVQSKTYFCDFQDKAVKEVHVNGHMYNGHMTARGLLTIENASGIASPPFTVSINTSLSGNETKEISSFRSVGNDITLIWSEQLPPKRTFFLETLKPCNENFNWFKYCSEQDLGTPLDLSGGFGLKETWSGHATLISPNTLSLYSAQFESTTNRNEMNITMRANDRLRVVCGEKIVESVSFIHLDATFKSCTLESIYGNVEISSLTVDGEEQLLDFDSATLSVSGRSFPVLERSRNVSGLMDWSFEDGIASKNTFDYDNTGIRYDLGKQHDDIRITGWSSIPDDNGQVLNLRILNEENTSMFTAYVWSKGLYVKTGEIEGPYGERIASVPANKWWYWSIQAEHHVETEHIADDHPVFNDNATYFKQEWKFTVRVENEVWTGIQPVESGVKLRSHFLKAAPSFHDIPNQERHECAYQCTHHGTCQQWSWSPDDGHCYLHAKRCHEDPECVHGTRLMNSLQSHKVSHFEISANEPKTVNRLPTRWRAIRAQPLLQSPTCAPIDMTNIDPRWRAPFQDQYIPFSPDATAICNHLQESWVLMPGYESKVCQGESCVYKPHDLKACGDHLETLVPEVPENCDSKKFWNTNWTAYCHYVTSFETVRSGGGVYRVPFLGGLEANMSDMCETPWHIYDDARSTCPRISASWFNECFERTSVYSEHCSAECVNSIDDMLSNINGSEGICSLRETFLDIQSNASGDSTGMPNECECNLDNIVISDFCLMQNAYHEGRHIRIPELFHSDCSYDCKETLKQSLNRTEWRTWCYDLSSGDIEGVCSKTVCECDVEKNIGVAGGRCELSCPSGVSDGLELACSGRNGQCFAIQPNEAISDEQEQIAQKETRLGSNFSGPLIPEWIKGPAPTMEGRCQCALGSGAACSIPCDRCNNGTYGSHMASQYGICDSFNGICRALPPFMRYNTKLELDDIEVSYNTTAFEASQGVYRWKHEDRFLFESDRTLLLNSLVESIDPKGDFLGRKMAMDQSDLKMRENVDTVLRIFRDFCWAPKETFEYLDNAEKVTFNGSVIYPNGSSTLKEIDVPSWGQCTKISISSDWYFCFSNGHLYAWNQTSQTPLIVREMGVSERPLEKMTFTKRNGNTIYGYGGEYQYTKTSQTFDEMYKITFYEREWHPYNIIFAEWELVDTIGTRPPAAVWAPMVSFFDELALVVSNGDQHKLYYMRYQTPSARAEWRTSTSLQYNAAVTNIKALSSKGVQIFFDDNTTKVLINGSWTSGAFVEVQPVSTLVFGYAAPTGTKMPCEMRLTNQSLMIGELVVATFDTPAQYARVFLEEWLTIDIFSRADIIQRFHNAIHWQAFPEKTLHEAVSLASRGQKQFALDKITRLHMHQSRWSWYRDIAMRYQLSSVLQETFVRYVRVNSETSNSFLNVSETSQEFLNFFSSVPVSFFGEHPTYSPSELSVRLEGDIYKRCVVVTGHYSSKLSDYEQKINFEIDQVVIRVQWSETSFRAILTRSNGPGRMEWNMTGAFRTMTLVMHLEEWLYDTAEPFQPLYVVEEAENWEALFQMFVMEDSMSTYSMLSQTNDFLRYTASHCSITAGKKCPGMTLYTDMPCSGRGRCSYSCQCTCEIAKSELASSDSALSSIDWTKSPYRGPGCEKVCPGYDGFNLSSICNSNGVCQRDGKCTCSQGFTGDACQFRCPVNSKNETCSLHGGCGTRAYGISTFQFSGDQYMDILTSKNKQHFKDALRAFYGTCELENYVSEPSSFIPAAVTLGTASLTLEQAQKICSETNKNINLDFSIRENRFYPSGMCVGVQKDQEEYQPVMLNKSTTEIQTLDILELFECNPSECSIEIAPDNDRTVLGLKHELDTPEYHFYMDYVHGNSKGQFDYIINGETFVMDIDWTPTSLVLNIGTTLSTHVLVNTSIPIEHVEFSILGKTITSRVYPSFMSLGSINNTIWLAPQYEKKYRLSNTIHSGYYYNVPSSDTGADRVLLNSFVAERECDDQDNCLGIVRWRNLFKETLYSLHSMVEIQGYDTFELNTAPPYDYYRRMSNVYKGVFGVQKKCQTIEPGLSAYPKVKFIESYDIPIQNADVRLALDDTTGAVEIGTGIWTKCWTRAPNIHTKLACYEEAKKKNYGFAFSETTQVCLIYSGITDPTKIKLDKYNSNTRLSLDDPCDENAEWFA